jgi:chaperonin GroES
MFNLPPNPFWETRNRNSFAYLKKINRKGESFRMNIRPLQDRVIVKRLEEEQKTKGGIIIPDTAKEKPIEGEVVAAGKGKVTEDGKLLPLDVKVGDRVLFSKYGGTEIKVDGEEYLIMREDDILGIVEK